MVLLSHKSDQLLLCQHRPVVSHLLRVSGRILQMPVKTLHQPFPLPLWLYLLSPHTIYQMAMTSLLFLKMLSIFASHLLFLLPCVFFSSIPLWLISWLLLSFHSTVTFSESSSLALLLKCDPLQHPITIVSYPLSPFTLFLLSS